MSTVDLMSGQQEAQVSLSQAGIKEASSPDRIGSSERVTISSRLTRFAFHSFRGAALCFGVFVAVNWLVAAVDGGIDSNLWWIDLRSLDWGLRSALLVSVAIAMVTFALKPTIRGPLRYSILALFAFGCLWAIRDMASALDLMGTGRIGDWNVPFSTGVATFFLGAFLCVAKAPLLIAPIMQGQSPSPVLVRLSSLAAMSSGAVLLFLLIPIGVMATFGKADYSRYEVSHPDNLAVVFGAGVRKDGTPSLALHDRTMSGIALYNQGRVSKLLFSGGPGPGATHETAAMEEMALENGVAPADILIDLNGFSTWDTAKNTAALAESGTSNLGSSGVAGGASIFAVTHGYHLPRVELAFQMHGLDVLTVPATETRPLQRRHYYALREVAGFWVYWGRRAIAQ
jgi:vancomycin permeability regulator SanA